MELNSNADTRSGVIIVVFLFFRQMFICHDIIIHLCLLMAKSMFSADFANKL